MANSGDWDSLDPADTYYAYSWNFVRLYGRSLMMFKSAPGAEGATLVPDLAESPGTPNADSTQWTYTLRQGVKFEDGTPVTSKDVKYAVERSLDKTTFPNGPTYFNDYLDLQGYTSPYQDPSPDKLGLTAIDTPDDRTIVFKLAKPFSGFDYFAQLPATIPVPQAKDTGTKYKEHVVSTGPVHVRDQRPGQELRDGPQPELGPGHRPQPQAAAGPDRGRAQRQLRRHRQPAALRRPRRRRSRARASARRPRAASSPTRTSRRTRTTPCSPAAGSPTSTARSRRWTTSTAARPCSSPTTAPATSAPTAAPPAATSPRTSCRRSSRARSSSTSTRRPATPATSTRPATS